MYWNVEEHLSCKWGRYNGWRPLDLLDNTYLPLHLHIYERYIFWVARGMSQFDVSAIECFILRVEQDKHRPFWQLIENIRMSENVMVELFHEFKHFIGHNFRV